MRVHGAPCSKFSHTVGFGIRKWNALTYELKLCLSFGS